MAVKDKDISPASILRDPSLEEHLIQNGLDEWKGSGVQPPETWVFVTIPRTMIDKQRSLDNQVRIGNPILDENKHSIVNAMEKKQKLPAVMAFREKGTEAVALGDGNHRYAVSDGYSHLNAYIIFTANDELRKILTLTANNRNGCRNSAEAMLHHAAAYVEEYGCKLDDAVKLFNVPRTKLREEIALNKFRCVFATVQGAANLDPTVQRSLADAIPKLTLSVTRKLVDVAIQTPGINANQINEYCDRYKTCVSPEQQVALQTEMADHFKRATRQKTNGGATNGSRGKKPIDDDAFFRMVDKGIDTANKPIAGLAARMTPQQAIKLRTFRDILDKILNEVEVHKIAV